MGIWSIQSKLKDTYNKQSDETKGYRESSIIGREFLGVLDEMKGTGILRVSVILSREKKV